jgi:tol-pal system protein YbgF
MAKLRFHGRFVRLSAVALTLLLVNAATAFAQSSNGKPAKGAPVAAAPAATAPGAAAPAGDAGLKARVESLEEQLVDMQVVVGTLESLAKNAGSAPAAFPAASSAPASSSGDAARIDSLETQVQALTAQIQQLSDQIRSLGGTPRRSEIPADTNTALSGAGADPGPDAGPIGPPSQSPSQASSQASSPGFGSTTVSSGGGDAIGGLLSSDTKSQSGAKASSPIGASGEGPDGGTSAVTPAAVSTAALPPAVEGPTDPKQLYETAYGYLLQRDYGAAEAAFDDFLKRFPNDSLSGNAQYWLGETHFVRGQYKAAAGAFLKGYQTYAQSAKAPDSLLKLAMSLDRLGQKDAACSSYAEFSTKFPNAPQSIKSRAQTERQRVGCK